MTMSTIPKVRHTRGQRWDFNCDTFVHMQWIQLVRRVVGYVCDQSVEQRIFTTCDD